MAETFGEILPLTIGVTFSPVPIAAVIVMLLSRRAHRNAVMFLVGWVVGLSGLGALVIVAGVGSGGGGDSSLLDLAKLILAALFLVLALNARRRTRRGGGRTEMPRWVATVDRINPLTAFGVGWGFGTFEPKNLALTTTAAAAIASAGHGAAAEMVLLATFVGIGTLGVAAPVVLAATSDRAGSVLTAAKEWLIDNTARVQVFLFPVVAALLLRDALG